jgi:hypothetical protein
MVKLRTQYAEFNDHSGNDEKNHQAYHENRIDGIGEMIGN